MYFSELIFIALSKRTVTIPSYKKDVSESLLFTKRLPLATNEAMLLRKIIKLGGANCYQ
jgi:hypothetical protein